MPPELEQKFEKVFDKIDKLFKVHEDHQKFLFGHVHEGKNIPGADERLRIVEAFVMSFKELQIKIRNTIIGSAGAIVTAIIIAALVK